MGCFPLPRPHLNFGALGLPMSHSVDAPDYIYKIILLGDSNVGKTNILMRYKDDEFDSNTKPTIGVELYSKKVPLDGKIIKASLWDTAGQERYRAVTTTYYRNSSGVFLVYDVTRQESFNNIQRWLKEVREYADPDVVIMLVGNKTDLNYMRAVSTEDGSKFAEQNGMFFMETSAMSNTNIDKAFEKIIEEIHRKNVDKQITGTKSTTALPKSGEVVRLDEQAAAAAGGAKKGGCCGK